MSNGSSSLSLHPRRETTGPPPKYYPPVVTVILSATIFFVAQLVATSIVLVYPLTHGLSERGAYDWLQDRVVAQFLLFLIAESLTVGLIVWLLRRRGVSLNTIGLDKSKFVDPFYATIGFAVYMAVLFAVTSLVEKFNAVNVRQEQQIGFSGAHGNQLILVFFSLVILPPIAEEILFRGFLFTGLRRKLPFIATLVITSVLFGVAHLQFGQGTPLLWIAAIDTFLLSSMLCFMREKTGSLWPGIYVHMVKNFIAFLALFAGILK